MDRPVLLCGLGKVGRSVLAVLRAAHMPVVVIDLQPAPANGLDGVRYVRGDFRQTDALIEAGVRDARGIIVCASDDLANLTAVLTARSLAPDVRIVVRTFNANLVDRLGRAVRNVYALSVSSLAAPLLALTALTGELIGAFTLDDGPRQVAELTVTPDSPLAGLRVAQAAERHRLTALAHRAAAGPPRFLHDLDGDAVLRAGDRLAVVGAPRDLGRLLSSGDSLDAVHWAGKLRRFGRVLGRTLAEVDLSVKVCTGVLLAVVVGSTLVFHFGIDRPLPESLVRTVSAIATAADLRAGELTGWQKVFVSFLRLVGVTLTAAFTAIFTQYLLRAKLGGAFEVRRVPDSGHVVLCGLGNLGFRVAEELLKADAQVVVIEPERDARFLVPIRRLGAAVLRGDATLPEVLKQARADTARGVVIATNNELANVEIALQVRELNPGQRVVVRLSDTHLAQTLREAANIRFALSIPALAAPAFVAALFGDRVQSVFLVAGRLLAAVELTVAAGDCLDGESARAAAIDYGLMPVALTAADGQPRSELLAHRLGPGDRLTAVAALPDLERLLRRERQPAEWAVEVTGFPLTARPQLALLVRTGQGVGAEAAEQALDRLPLCLQRRLTRGQAEDLLALLGRERIAARVIPDGTP
jgi:Trk K+ transport system NAD-binding subunit